MHWKLLTILILGCVKHISCDVLQIGGVYEFQASDQSQIIHLHRDVYNQTEIAVRIDCYSDPHLKLRIEWLLWYSPCANGFATIGKNIIENALTHVPKDPTSNPLSNVFLQQASFQTIIADCNTEIHLPDERSRRLIKPGEELFATDSKSFDCSKEAASLITSTTQDGNHLFVLTLSPVTAHHADERPFTADVRVSMKSPFGFLSRTVWPLLPFYSTMYFVYVLFAIMWIILVICNKRDSLPIQYFLGGVIFIGVLEQAFMFGLYLVDNITGKIPTGLEIFAEEISVLKRALMRVSLVLISAGIGTLKPLRGIIFNGSVAVATIYFTIATVENLRLILENYLVWIIASIYLLVLDIVIWAWIIANLIKTFQTLPVNESKAQRALYKYFTLTLVLAAIAVLVFMICELWEHRVCVCSGDWTSDWVNEVFWQVHNCVLLVINVFLWRPTTTNQRYAYSPLMDDQDEVKEDIIFGADKISNKAVEKPKTQAWKANQILPKEVKISKEEEAWDTDRDLLSPAHG